MKSNGLSIDECVLIVANGDLTARDQLLSAMAETSFWIAVDGGIRHFIKLDRMPHLWIGDMDSYSETTLIAMGVMEDQLSDIRQRLLAVPKETHAPEKDLSDSQLALEWALNRGYRKLVLMGMLGGRTDHMLFNIALLKSIMLGRGQGLIIGDREWIFLLGGPDNQQRSLVDLKGTTISLYPFTALEGITLTGVYYPLKDAAMSMGDTLCLSNIVTADIATLTIARGLGLVIVNKAIQNIQQGF